MSLILKSNISHYICVTAHLLVLHNAQVKLINLPAVYDNKSQILPYCNLRIAYITNPVYIKLHWPHLFGKMKVRD